MTEPLPPQGPRTEALSRWFYDNDLQVVRRGRYDAGPVVGVFAELARFIEAASPALPSQTIYCIDVADHMQRIEGHRAVEAASPALAKCHARVGEGWSCNQPKGHAGFHGVLEVSEVALPALDVRVLWPAGANWSSGKRQIIVELPAIGEDGLCKGCGTKPTRDTGSCRCLHSVARLTAAVPTPGAER